MTDIKPPLMQALSLAIGIESKLMESGGEITPEIMELIEIKDEILINRIDAYAHAIKRLESRSMELNELIGQYEKIETSIHNAAIKMKERVQFVLDSLEVNELQGREFKFAKQRGAPKTEVFDESLIPKRFFKITEHLSKSDIAESLKKGETVPGARLVENYHLRIKLLPGKGKPNDGSQS